MTWRTALVTGVFAIALVLLVQELPRLAAGLNTT
jgi:hypothetical protein